MGAAELVFAFYLGAAKTLSAPLSITEPATHTHLTFSNITYRGESLSPPLYYGYRVGFFPKSHSWIGIEGEFTHLKVYANTDAPGIRPVIERFSMSHGLNLALANATVRRSVRSRPDGAPAVRLSARIGAGPTVPHVESTVRGISRDAYQLGALVVQGGVGLELTLSHHLSALAEYKVTRTHQVVDIAGGDARGVFLSHHAIFGLAWHTR